MLKIIRNLSVYALCASSAFITPYPDSYKSNQDQIKAMSNTPIKYAVESASTSPDSKYIAIAVEAEANLGNKIEIYTEKKMSFVIGALNDPFSDVVSVRFSPVLTPDNTYLLAVARKTNSGANQELLIFEFDPTSPSLTLVDAENLETNVNGITWRPTGDRLLVAQDVTGSELLLYSVDTSTGALTFNSSLSLSGSVVFEQALDWNPGYIDYAIVSTTMVGTNPNLYSILFDPTATSMSIESATTLTTPVNIVALEWQESGNYILGGTLEGFVGIAKFVPTVAVTGFAATEAGSPVRAVAWNPHGTLFAFGSESSSGSEFQIHCFNPDNMTGRRVSEFNFVGDVRTMVWAVDNITVMGTGFNGGNITVYNATQVLLDTLVNMGCHYLDCCEETNSKIDTLSSGPCGHVPLFSAPSITLSTPSITYCLEENFNGNITIDAIDVVLDLNGHVVQGIIDISNNGHNALIHNGKIAVSTPVDNAQADYGVVHIHSNARNVHLVNCIIQTGSVQNGTSTNAFNAVNIEGNSTLISNCDIRTDSGGNGLVGGNGGHCVVIQGTAENTHIVESRLSAGYGGSSNSTATISTGAGGIGVYNAGRYTLIRSCDIRAGSGGNLLDITGDVADGVFVRLGIGGNAVTNTGTGLSLYNSVLQGGSGGVIRTVTSGNVGINPGGAVVVGGGGDALYVASDQSLVVSECELYAGESGFIDSIEGIGINGANVAAARGGYGIWFEFGFFSNYTPVISNSKIYAGNSGNFFASNGDIGSSTSAIATDAAGDGIHTSSYGMQIIDCVVAGGNGASLLTSNGTIYNTNGGRGGHGIVDLSGTKNSVVRCQVHSGLGGHLNASSGDILGTTYTGNGGIGILLDGTAFTLIKECTIAAASSGSSVAGSTNLSTSGEGGTGIFITGITDGTRVRTTSIGPTGSSGSVFGIGGTSGAAGDGIKIDINVGYVDPIEISNCKISYTGYVGSADTQSTSLGQAIRDLSPNAMIYSNCAEHIADTVTPYMLAINVPIVAIDAPTGTPFAFANNPFANIYR